MILDWIFKRLFTPKRVASLIKNNQVVIAEMMKSSIHDVLQDDEIAQHLIQYTDEVYNRYLGKSGKLWSSIGGAQKGINYAVQGEMDKLNPFQGFMDADGEISLSGIVKGVLSQALRGKGTQQPQGQGIPGSRSRGTPNMQPI